MFTTGCAAPRRRSVWLIREEDLEQSVVAFDDWSRFAAPDIEGLFRQRSGAIPPAAAERREKRGGIGQARGACLHHLGDRLQIRRLPREQQ